MAKSKSKSKDSWVEYALVFGGAAIASLLIMKVIKPQGCGCNSSGNGNGGAK